MIFHINRAVGTYFNIPLLTPFIRMGNCGVDVFLFLSGYCLALSFMRDSRIVNFLPKPVLWMFFITLVLPIIYLLGWLFSKTNIEGLLMRSLLFFGNLSLEVYMIHVMILHVFVSDEVPTNSEWMWYLVIPIATLLISYIANLIVKRLINCTTIGNRTNEKDISTGRI